LTFDLRALKIFIDGSCLSNPGGGGGFAVRLEFPFDWGQPDKILDSVGFFETTNNRMELLACIFAQEWILEEIEYLVAKEVQYVQIVTDSKYVYENYNRSIGWSKNGWRNFQERPLDNTDLWKDLLRTRKKLGGRVRVEVKLIAGKSSPITKSVDREAKIAAANPTKPDHGFQAGKIGRSKNNTGRAAKMFASAGGKLLIRIYKTERVRKNIQKIRFQTFSEERQDFFEKYFAYSDDTIGNMLHRQHKYLVQMNSLPKYPCIEEICEEID